MTPPDATISTPIWAPMFGDPVQARRAQDNELWADYISVFSNTSTSAVAPSTGVLLSLTVPLHQPGTMQLRGVLQTTGSATASFTVDTVQLGPTFTLNPLATNCLIWGTSLIAAGAHTVTLNASTNSGTITALFVEARRPSSPT